MLDYSNSESQVTPECKSPTNQSCSHIALRGSISSETVTRIQEECDTISNTGQLYIIWAHTHAQMHTHTHTHTDSYIKINERKHI